MIRPLQSSQHIGIIPSRWRAPSFRLGLVLRSCGWGVVLLCSMALPVWAQEEGTGGRESGPEWRTVVKWTGVTSHAKPGESGHVREGDDTRQATELSLRVQVQGRPAEHWGYRLDYLNLARDSSAFDNSGNLRTGADLYRYKPWRRDLESPETRPGEASSTQTFRWTHEIDHALLRLGGESWETVLGRQPVTWGVGRFWSPTDLFAAFHPLALDTEYKPGVDALTLSWFPGDLSELNWVGVATPADEPRLNDSAALRWRMQVGDESELTLVAASVREETLAGGSIETAWLGAGWRLEGVAFRPRDVDPLALSAAGVQGALLPRDAEETYGYWVLGVDMQMTGSGPLEGTVLVAEIYRNTLGARNENDLARVVADPRTTEGRMPHLAATVAALAADKDIGGLWRLGYALFAAPLEDADGARKVSSMHRLSLAYSIGDDAEALLAVSGGSGKGLSDDPFAPLPRSEFGHVPKSLLFSVTIVL